MTTSATPLVRYNCNSTQKNTRGPYILLVVVPWKKGGSVHQRLHATEVHATPVFSFPLSLSLVLVQQRTLCLRRSGTATSTLLMVRSLSTTSRCSTTTRLYVPFVSVCVCMRVCACVYVSSPLSLSLSLSCFSVCVAHDACFALPTFLSAFGWMCR